MYSPYPQAAVTTFTVVARTIGEPALAMPAAREVLRALDPTLPFYDVRTMDERVASSFAETRAMTLVLGVTALLTVSLAAVAIYGSILFSVSQRVPEIGLRRALGASGRSVCMSVAGQALQMTAAGTALGIAATAAAGPLLRAFLFETPANDATTLLSVAATLLAVTIVACVVPVRRALSVDPIAALRSE
jgi:putative ABC transport system permease protein